MNKTERSKPEIIKKNKRVWESMMLKYIDGNFPKKNSSEWQKENLEYRKADDEYREIGIVLKFLKFEETFLVLSNKEEVIKIFEISKKVVVKDVEKKKTRTKEVYDLMWGEILKIVNTKNFPHKNSKEWSILLERCRFIDSIYMEKYREKGTLEITVKKISFL